MTNISQTRAEAVSLRVDPTRAIDPALIAVILQIVMEVLKMWKECKADDPTEGVRNLRPFQRIRLNWTARRELNRRGHDGSLGPKVVSETLDEIASMPVEEIVFAAMEFEEV